MTAWWRCRARYGPSRCPHCPHFLDGTVGRAAFRVAELEAIGLPDGCALGIVCVDALGRNADVDAALRELARVLAPGGRLVLTRSLRRGAEPAWHEQARAASLAMEHVDERPAEPATCERLCRLWIAHVEELRHELGEGEAQNMLREAHQVLPTLPGRRAVLLTLRRPRPPRPGPARPIRCRIPAAVPATGPLPAEGPLSESAPCCSCGGVLGRVLGNRRRQDPGGRRHRRHCARPP
ncbi:class I SAM-dependent methyltransferase [Streptomyces sp. CG4]|uniref:class I SAM-dependent methyltransferase n=1 Tax=Streptomyces sp. CG4 TaxID=408783 RepID=UPI0034E1EB93